MTEALSLFAVPGVPLIGEGDSIAEIILQQLQAADYLLAEGDVIVIAQKIISKAEGRYRRLGDINPGVEAIDLARQCDKDPRLVQAILDESESVVRVKPAFFLFDLGLAKSISVCATFRSPQNTTGFFLSRPLINFRKSRSHSSVR